MMIIATNRTKACVAGLVFAFSPIACGNDNHGIGSRDVDGNPQADGDIVIASAIEDVFSIGGAGGEAWASFVAVTDIVFDTTGHLVVLDNLQRRIVVVAPDGGTHHEISRSGEGPGELRFPLALTAMRDGRLGVYDDGHKSFLVFGPGGDFSERFPVDQEAPIIGRSPSPTSLIGKKFRALPGGRILAFGGFGTGPGRPVEIIDLGVARDTLVVAWDLATKAGPDTQGVLPSATDMTVLGHNVRRPHFSPPLLVDVLSDGRVAVVDSVGYRIKVLSARGTTTNVIERSIAPRDVTSAIRQSVRNAKEGKLTENAGVTTDGVTVMASGGASPDVVQALVRHAFESDLQDLTFAEQVPVIDAMAIDSEDRIWVARTGSDGVADGPTDIFSSSGEYLGTLPATGLRIPTAFGPEGLMAYVEKDNFDAVIVRVIRLLRFETPGGSGA